VLLTLPARLFVENRRGQGGDGGVWAGGRVDRHD
jgi:hypothetical protein